MILKADQDIRGLQIAVQNTALMRVQHAVASVHEQLQPCLNTYVFQIAMRMNGKTRDQRHGEPRAAIRRSAAFKNRGHIGVIHQSHGLLLGPKSGENSLAVHALLQHFYCGRALHWRVLCAQIHKAISALAKLAKNFKSAKFRRHIRLFSWRAGAVACVLVLS